MAEQEMMVGERGAYWLTMPGMPWGDQAALAGKTLHRAADSLPKDSRMLYQAALAKAAAEVSSSGLAEIAQATAEYYLANEMLPEGWQDALLLLSEWGRREGWQQRQMWLNRAAGTAWQEAAIFKGRASLALAREHFRRRAVARYIWAGGPEPADAKGLVRMLNEMHPYGIEISIEPGTFTRHSEDGKTIREIRGTITLGYGLWLEQAAATLEQAARFVDGDRHLDFSAALRRAALKKAGYRDPDLVMDSALPYLLEQAPLGLARLTPPDELLAIWGRKAGWQGRVLALWAAGQAARWAMLSVEA